LKKNSGIIEEVG